MTIKTLLLRAKNDLAHKAYREAHAACIEILKQAPETAEAYYLLGILTADHDNHNKAVELFQRALAYTPDDAAALAQMARSLIALNRREEALDTVLAAAKKETVNAYTLDTIGVVYSRAGRHETAISFYEKATEAVPDNPEYHYNYASALQFLGQMEQARAAYRQAIKHNPDDARSYAGIVTITKQTQEDNEIAALEALFPRFDQDEVASLNLGHAIAKAYEDLGDSDAALTWLHKAKALKKQSLRYNPEFDRALFETAMRLADDFEVSPSEQTGPIFIVGMPRTGTTLVDRVISSHSQVVSAGELTDFGLLLKQATKTPGPYVLDAPTLQASRDIDLHSIGLAYDSRVRNSLELGQSIFTDKMPLNILYAPLLLKAFPGARIICLRRHPADTVLSNYRQLFATAFSYYNYAYDLETTARYYAQFSGLVDHYTETLPADRFTVAAYEDVVTDIDAQTRRLLAFCNLPFEQACVDFHTNKAPVATASSAQVRQPVYKTALARWKRYRPGLDPALSVLVEEGCLPASVLT